MGQIHLIPPLSRAAVFNSVDFSFFEFLTASGSPSSGAFNFATACFEYGSFNALGSVFNRVAAEVDSEMGCCTVGDDSGSGSAKIAGLTITLGEDSLSCWPISIAPGFSRLFHFAKS